MKTLKVSPKRF